METAFCDHAGKVAYLTKTVAKAALAGMVDRYCTMRVYQCRYCGRFHIGRQGKLKNRIANKNERSHNVKWRVGFSRPQGL